MGDAPTNDHGGEPEKRGVDWNDYAELHLKGDGSGVLYSLKTIRHGTLAELVRHVAGLPQGEREKYYIEKAGDHRLDTPEILMLSRRSDLPAS